MKRGIRFRALTKSGEWVYGMPCKSNYGIELVTELYHVDGAEWNEYGEDVKPETVGQFTGLHDKNGQEIYEGDIVAHAIEGYTTPLSVVEFKDGMFVFTDSEYSTELIESLDYCEVIGNTYENPELLKA